ncbi:MAG: FecR domain-containing protein [Micavibrio sp.]|nr:FecR domain-containing protein [Micavibrio sp.]
MENLELQELGFDSGVENHPDITTLQINGSSLELPDNSYIKDGEFAREGGDLILSGNDGSIKIEGYFDALEAPTLHAPDGSALTPELVQSFAQSPLQYAATSSLNDASPIGLVSEVSGDATVTHPDGTTSPVHLGTEIHQGDIVQTQSDGAVNITFTDESSFAISQDARVAIDEYVYDPSTQEGAQNFSVLKGLFVFTSGLVGRDDPDDVHINTPSGSIGIRGTIIAGDTDKGEITVVEGAIVLRDFNGNEMTLAGQFETAQFGGADNGGIQNMGLLQANDVSSRFSGVSKVAPKLFSSINDSAGEATNPGTDVPQQNGEQNNTEGAQESTPADANGSVDQNNDNQVDGTVEGADEGSAEGVETQTENSSEATGEASAQATTDATSAADSNLTNSLSSNKLATSTLDSPRATAQQNSNQTIAKGVSLSGTKSISANKNATQQETSQRAAEKSQVIDTLPRPPQQDPNENQQTFHEINHFRTMHENGVSLGNILSIAPDDFFALTQQNHEFRYNFDKEFTSTPSSSTYELSTATIQTLDSMQASGEIASWDFNVNLNGDLFIDGGASTFTNDSFNFEIRAVGNDGYSTPFKSYTMQLEDGTHGNVDLPLLSSAGGYSGGTFILTDGAPNEVILGDTATAAFTSNENTIFMNEMPHTLTIHDGNDNTAFMADANNTIHLKWSTNTSVTGNKIFGGDMIDNFEIYSASNQAYGMDGDDIFTLNFTATNNLSTQIYTASTDAVIDGGWSGFNTGFELRDLGIQSDYADNSGYGDTLKLLMNFGDILDFAQVRAGYFRGIERIDMGDLNNDASIIGLKYNDIVEMTDIKNVLIFRGDSEDIVSFDGFNTNNTQKVHDNVMIEQDGTDVQFDIYEATGTAGKVTLLIEQNGGGDAFAANGLPAA